MKTGQLLKPDDCGQTYQSVIVKMPYTFLLRGMSHMMQKDEKQNT